MPVSPTCERFRTLDEVFEPDSRQASFGGSDPATGEFRSRTIEDIHASIRDLELHEGVPKEVQVQFETARNE